MINPAINYIKIFDEPTDITVNDATGTVYVSNTSGKMARIDYVSPEIFSFGEAVNNNLPIAGFKANPVNNNVYVCNNDSSYKLPPIYIYDQNLKFISPLTGIPDIAGNWPIDPYFYKINNELYFTHTHGLIVIDAPSGGYKKNIDTSASGKNNYVYSISASNLGYLFLGKYDEGEVMPIELSSGEVATIIELGRRNQPSSLAVDNKRSMLLIGVRKILGLDGFSIDKYTVLSHRKTGSIDLGTEENTSLAIDEINDVLYAVSETSVKVYSLDNDTLMGEIEINNGKYISFENTDDLVPVIHFDERRNILYLLDGKAKGKDSHLIVLDNSVVLNISYPLPGTTMPSVPFTVHGTGSSPGSWVDVILRKNDEFWQAQRKKIAPTGRWEAQILNIAPGNYTVTAVQTINGVENRVETTFSCV